MNESLAAVTGILVLATITEAIVEHLFAPVLDARDPAGVQPAPVAGEPTPGNMSPEPVYTQDWRALVLRYVSVLIGVALCIVYRVDLLLYFNLSSPWPWAGWLITGLLIGRGSNFVHDFAGRWLTKPSFD